MYVPRAMILKQPTNDAKQVAEVLSNVVCREVSHVPLSEAELSTQLQATGIPESYASMLAKMDLGIKAGAEERLNNTVQKVIGRPPMTFRAFAEANIRSQG